MYGIDIEEIKKHVDIMKVAYHLDLEIMNQKGNEAKVICPFCRLQ